ncbi:MAG: heme NO-binding domain-containing protein [Burkholderiaceae bacterium]
MHAAQRWRVHRGGTYDHAEMVALCNALAEHTGESATDLIESFGVQLSGAFARGYPEFFGRCSHLFDFLESIEGHIHVEVRKLYPDAELPTFTIHERSASRLVMDYRSTRRLGTLAEGLIAGSAQRFGVEARVRSEPLDDGDGQAVRFIVDLV